MRFLAGIFGFVGVSMGAFGAHGLKSILSSTQLNWWETATFYLLIHSVLQVIVTLNRNKFTEKSYRAINISLTTGHVLFAGSLYILALTQVKILGAITPLGGIAYLAAWLFIAFNKTRK